MHVMRIINCKYRQTEYLGLATNSGSSLRIFSRSDRRVNLFSILPSDTRRGCTVATALTGSDTDDMRVDSAGHAVADFDVQFGDDVFRVDGSLADIPNGCTLDHVPHCETLDGLVLGYATRAV